VCASGFESSAKRVPEIARTKMATETMCHVFTLVLASVREFYQMCEGVYMFQCSFINVLCFFQCRLSRVGSTDTKQCCNDDPTPRIAEIVLTSESVIGQLGFKLRENLVSGNLFANRVSTLVSLGVDPIHNLS